MELRPDQSTHWPQPGNNQLINKNKTHSRIFVNNSVISRVLLCVLVQRNRNTWLDAILTQNGGGLIGEVLMCTEEKEL